MSWEAQFPFVSCLPADTSPCSSAFCFVDRENIYFTDRVMSERLQLLYYGMSLGLRKQEICSELFCWILWIVYKTYQKASDIIAGPQCEMCSDGSVSASTGQGTWKWKIRSCPCGTDIRSSKAVHVGALCSPAAVIQEVTDKGREREHSGSVFLGYFLLNFAFLLVATERWS